MRSLCLRGAGGSTSSRSPGAQISLAAATAAILDQTHARKSWENVKRERTRVISVLSEMGFDVLPSQANFVLARIETPSAGSLYESLKADNILIRYFDYPGLADKLRITIGRPEENDALIQSLRKHLA